MSPLRLSALLLALAVTLAACGTGGAADQTSELAGSATAVQPGDDQSSDDAAGADRGVLRIDAIPDQDPEVLARHFDLVADVLGEALDVDVEYVPVTEYNASVNLFRTGDIDLTWFGTVTGIQARLQTPTARVIAQRDIDAAFTSTFIASTNAGIEPF